MSFDPAWVAPEGLLAGRVVVVTGASEGIGRAVARGLAAHGATVVAFARTVARLESLYDEIVAAGGPEPVIQAVDLEGLGQNDAHTLASALDEAFGRVDGLLHNASQLGPRVPLAGYDPAAWKRVMQVNLDAGLLLTQAFLPLLEAGTDPLVLFTSSGVGREPRAYWGAYAVSKAATEALVTIFADELEQVSPVRFASLDPGGTRTAMRAAAYPGEDPETLPTPEDLVPLYLWLFGASRDAAIHGARVDAREWLGIAR